MGQGLLWIAPAVGAFGLILSFVLSSRVQRHPAGTQRMQEIGEAIREGAAAFLRREFGVLAIVGAIVAVVLALVFRGVPRSHWLVAVAFTVGAACSALAGLFGMRAATRANVRTANAARSGLTPALEVAFAGGTVVGFAVVGLGLLGVGGLFLLFSSLDVFRGPENLPRLLTVLSGFLLGASSFALLARLGGGIFTKGADIGADLVGKLESGIPEDDPRNPAVIADNVGDNVGDVAGMGANLFESYVGAIVGAMILGATESPTSVILPLLVAALGVGTSLLGMAFTRMREGRHPSRALNGGTLVATGLTLIGAGFIVGGLHAGSGRFAAIACGLIAGVLIGGFTEYACARDGKPVRTIVKASTTGAATNVIAGVAVGMASTAIPMLLLAAAIALSFHWAGLYGVALAAVGMLSTTGIQLAVFAYGPIADNAGGIAQMSGLPREVRQRTDVLDAAGNTTAAIGRGFAIGSAALTALALFSAFQTQVGLQAVDVLRPNVIAGLFVGATLPFLFSSMALRAVGRAAATMIAEVRRQFREIPGLLAGEARPDYVRTVDLSTRAALRDMTLPGVLAVVLPLVAGFADRTGGALSGLIAGALVSGIPLAMFLSISGSAWDNAKKRIEDGDCGGKNSDAHRAAITGDTVGDPFKDTAGPSLNILVKLLSVVALLIAPLINRWGLGLWG